jgi:hypothetical protein
MVSAIRSFRLAQLPKSGRAVIACAVVLLGTGYLVALLNLYLSYAMADGSPALTQQDVKLHLHGDRQRAVLAGVIAPGGKMEQYLRDARDRDQILSWIQEGATEAGFAPVQTILNRDCIKCHSRSGSASFRPLTTFAEVSQVTQLDRGESLATWARIAHSHLQSLALVYLALGLLFCFTGAPERLKIIAGTAPFIALFTDFGARCLAHYWPAMVPLVMASGAVAALATGVLMLGIFWEVWLVRLPAASPAPEHPPAR